MTPEEKRILDDAVFRLERLLKPEERKSETGEQLEELGRVLAELDRVGVPTSHADGTPMTLSQGVRYLANMTRPKNKWKPRYDKLVKEHEAFRKELHAVADGFGAPAGTHPGERLVLLLNQRSHEDAAPDKEIELALAELDRAGVPRNYPGGTPVPLPQGIRYLVDYSRGQRYATIAKRLARCLLQLGPQYPTASEKAFAAKVLKDIEYLADFECPEPPRQEKPAPTEKPATVLRLFVTTFSDGYAVVVAKNLERAKLLVSREHQVEFRNCTEIGAAHSKEENIAFFYRQPPRERYV